MHIERERERYVCVYIYREREGERGRDASSRRFCWVIVSHVSLQCACGYRPFLVNAPLGFKEEQCVLQSVSLVLWPMSC